MWPSDFGVAQANICIFMSLTKSCLRQALHKADKVVYTSANLAIFGSVPIRSSCSKNTWLDDCCTPGTPNPVREEMGTMKGVVGGQVRGFISFPSSAPIGLHWECPLRHVDHWGWG